MSGAKRKGIPLIPLEIRFWSKVNKTETCWLWTASLDKAGYGYFKALNQRNAHRVSWAMHKGPIPNGMWVLHKCDVRNCVNPEHLFLGDQFANMADMVSKGRHNNGKTKRVAFQYVDLGVKK